MLEKITTAGFKIIALKMTQFTVANAKKFYEIHKDRPFYEDLYTFMSSGPIVAAILEKENAVDDFRALVRQNQGLNQLMMTILLEQINKNNDRLHRLLLYKSRQRVVQFLLDYVNEIGQRVGYEFVIKKPFTHEEIGNLSDTSRQTVTTVLNELKSKNLIHFTRRYILIRNLEALGEEAKKEG